MPPSYRVSQVHALQNDNRKEAHRSSAENSTAFLWQFKIQKPLRLLPDVNVVNINIYSTIILQVSSAAQESVRPENLEKGIFSNPVSA